MLCLIICNNVALINYNQFETLIYICFMPHSKTNTVRIDNEVLSNVKLHSDKLGMSIKIFIERAINEKIKRIKAKKKL